MLVYFKTIATRSELNWNTTTHVSPRHSCFSSYPTVKYKKRHIGITVGKMRSGNEHRISNVIYGMYNVSVGTERQTPGNSFSFFLNIYKTFIMMWGSSQLRVKSSLIVTPGWYLYFILILGWRSYLSQSALCHFVKWAAWGQRLEW